MKFSKQTLLGRLIPSIFFLLTFTGCATQGPFDNYQVINAVEPVIIHGKETSHEESGKMDTGAIRCSLHLDLAKALGLEKLPGPFKNKDQCPSDEIFVESANGTECRPVYLVPMTIAETIHTTGECSGADREHLKLKVLIGRNTFKAHRLLVSSDNGLTKEEEEAEEN